jgi:CRISPR/Cas system CMR-associated protein Cmr3 (group 5 of RAMP superfamily)
MKELRFQPTEWTRNMGMKESDKKGKQRFEVRLLTHAVVMGKGEKQK